MVSKKIKRTKYKYRKKDPRYRKTMIMEVIEDLPMAREVTEKGIDIINLPKGRYEVRIVAHPQPDKRNRFSRWIIASCNGHQIGMAKSFVNTLRKQGLVRIFLLGEKA